MLLSENDIKSELSVAYVHAVAAHAGYNCGIAPGLDRDSVDVQVSAGGRARPKVDFQLKASASLTGNNTHFKYLLSIKNYNDLRAQTQTPRALVVLDLPPNKNDWLKITSDMMILKRSAYWISIKGWAESKNLTSVTIYIPKSNIFDVENLRDIMERSRDGRI